MCSILVFCWGSYRAALCRTFAHLLSYLGKLTMDGFCNGQIEQFGLPPSLPPSLPPFLLSLNQKAQGFYRLFGPMLAASSTDTNPVHGSSSRGCPRVCSFLHPWPCGFNTTLRPAWWEIVLCRKRWTKQLGSGRPASPDAGAWRS